MLMIYKYDLAPIKEQGFMIPEGAEIQQEIDSLHAEIETL